MDDPGSRLDAMLRNDLTCTLWRQKGKRPEVNGTILIVDDDEDTAVLLRDSLRKRGFDVDAVT